MADPSPTRPDGYYWTSYDDGSGVEIREWNGGHWRTMGLDVYFPDEDFAVLAGPVRYGDHHPLLDAARELLSAAGRTIFHVCSICEPDTDFGGGDDSMSVDGGSAPLTIGHLRRLRDALAQHLNGGTNG